MKKFEKILAAIGFLGLAISILAIAFNLHTLVIIGGVVFFASVIGVLAVPAIGGYNPVEHGETKPRWYDGPRS